jgi:hypothetical protein
MYDQCCEMIDEIRAQMRENLLARGISTFLIGAASGLLLVTAASPDHAAGPSPSQEALVKSEPEVWDSNHDGVVTCDEWKSFLGRIFALADRNHDGHLDPSEFATVRKAGGALAEADFGYFDENQDGKITRDEFVGKPSEFILRYDKNGDCRVTPDETRAANTPKVEGPPVRERDRFHDH